ncbi:MAG: hypothetical protein ACRDGM_04080 [bacterium]
MGQAFDETGKPMGDGAVGGSFREVLDKLERAHPDAAEYRLRHIVGSGAPDAPQVEMPRYRCHKEVQAVKISGIVNNNPIHRQDDDGARLLVPADPQYGAFLVSAEFMRKHDPKPGGYYVR